jgi:hypothetical protein
MPDYRITGSVEHRRDGRRPSLCGNAGRRRCVLGFKRLGPDDGTSVDANRTSCCWSRWGHINGPHSHRCSYNVGHALLRRGESPSWRPKQRGVDVSWKRTCLHRLVRWQRRVLGLQRPWRIKRPFLGAAWPARSGKWSIQLLRPLINGRRGMLGSQLKPQRSTGRELRPNSDCRWVLPQLLAVHHRGGYLLGL